MLHQSLNRIYLLGLPGSGKSTLGKQLALALNYDFVDLDAAIEVHERKLIPTIFEENGESYFRELERTVLLNTVNFSKTVISCGGGTPCFFNNMDWMNTQGATVFLDVSVDEILSRLSSQQHRDRPLLKDSSLHSLRETRIAFYEKAQIRSSSLEEILNALG